MITAESRPTVWLPDDLEERWEKMESVERRDVIRYWRERNAAGTMGWQARRRIRKLLGGPLTENYVVQNAERLERDERERKDRLRRIRRYGEEVNREIEVLATKLMVAHSGVSDDRALAWAEKTYRRENCLD